MTDYFDEKAHQVDTGTLEAFGIELTSRYCKAGELAEMLNFARRVALQGLHAEVTEVFYDSKSCCAFFKFRDGFDPYGEAAAQLRECALSEVGQFDWFGTVLHGLATSGDDEDDTAF